MGFVDSLQGFSFALSLDLVYTGFQSWKVNSHLRVIDAIDKQCRRKRRGLEAVT